MTRPQLTNTTSAAEFRAFYWLKQELVTCCQTYHLNNSRR